ncbi:MAG: hypothetical protein K5888_04600 [Lachnospiraceae bacterium]|nr:hypothetical protein [Lachnospiraceae bacterium]
MKLYDEDKDEKLENDFFEGETKKGFAIRMLIVLGIFLAGIIVIFIILSLRKPEENKVSDIQSNIIDYAKEESDLSTPLPTEEPSETPASEATPYPTPDELISDQPQEVEYEDKDDNGFGVHGIPMDTGKKDYRQVKFDTKHNLKEMEDYFDKNNNEAIRDLAYLDRFIAMSYSLNFSDEDCYYYGDVNEDGKPDGKGIAVYSDNRYYCGEWKNGKRNGTGKWVHFHIHENDNIKDKVIYHEFKGEFKNDLPNGEGQDHYEYNLELLSKNKNYITNYICSYNDGLIDKEVYCTSTDSEGNYIDWQGEASKGSFIYISESRDNLNRGPVMTDRENPDSYMWISDQDNRNIGVISYE